VSAASRWAAAFGRLARRFGLALDNVRAVEIVCADGQIRRADAHENPELYWGTRGGGGNFGVVTAFEFKLHPMQRQVVGGRILFPYSQAKSVLNFYSDYEADRAGGALARRHDREQPRILRTQRLRLRGVSLRQREPGGRGHAQDPQSRDPVFDSVAAIDYVALQRSGDDSEQRAIGSYTKTGYVGAITPQLIRRDDRRLAPTPSGPRSPAPATRRRDRARARPCDRNFHFARSMRRAAARQLAATSDLGAALEGHRDYWGRFVPFTDGFYTNDAVEESQSMDENYRDNYPRLVKLKNQVDPTNLFRLNANVRPSCSKADVTSARRASAEPG